MRVVGSGRTGRTEKEKGNESGKGMAVVSRRRRSQDKESEGSSHSSSSHGDSAGHGGGERRVCAEDLSKTHSPAAGHWGVRRTVALLKMAFTFASKWMKRKVQACVRICDVCQRVQELQRTKEVQRGSDSAGVGCVVLCLCGEG